LFHFFSLYDCIFVFVCTLSICTWLGNKATITKAEEAPAAAPTTTLMNGEGFVNRSNNNTVLKTNNKSKAPATTTV